MKKNLLLSLTVSAILAGCATESTPPAATTEPTTQAALNDFPTRDRVEYVLSCIAQHGGLTYINQYACGCKIDKIAEKMTFSEFDAARTFNYIKGTPGEVAVFFVIPRNRKICAPSSKKQKVMGKKTVL